jgi:hypothetical protein
MTLREFDDADNSRETRRLSPPTFGLAVDTPSKKKAKARRRFGFSGSRKNILSG